MSEPAEPKPPPDPAKSTPQPTAAESAKLASADVPEGSDTARAFISYASADTSIANSVCSALEREGVKCWIAPRDVTPGELYAGNIVHAIDTTRVVVLVLSQHAADSAHVLREVERASSKRHPIVSFRIDLTPLPDDFAYFLNTSQWLDASATGVDRALPRLVDAVRSALGKRTDTARVNQPPPVTVKASWRRKHTFVALAIIMAAALAFFVADRFWLSKRVDPQPALVGATPATPADSSGAPTIPAKSIAVLPFINMSGDTGNEYFADGLSEELINLLTKIPDLRVAARTSAFKFKGEKINVQDAAQKLNVAHVLEGSVRKSGNKVRITAQLITAADGYHLWSETYDRTLDDIFAVQDDIARAVVKALQVILMGPALGTHSKPQDPEAYNLALQGRYFLDRGDLERSIAYFQQSRERDPKYAPAWAGLAHAYASEAIRGLVPIEEGYRRARDAAQKALELDPQLVDAHLAMGWIHIAYDWNWAAAEATSRRALALEPANVQALLRFGHVAMILGRWDEALDAINKVIERDPLVPDSYFSRGLILRAVNRDTEAETAFRKAFELNPGGEFGHLAIGRQLLLQGETEAALREIQQEKDEYWRLSGLPLVYHALGQRRESDATLAAFKSKYGAEGAYQIAEVHAFRGEADLAFEWLERAYDQRDPGVTEIKGDRLFHKLFDDPRYKAFLKKMKLPE